MRLAIALSAIVALGSASNEGNHDGQLSDRDSDSVMIGLSEHYGFSNKNLPKAPHAERKVLANKSTPMESKKVDLDSSPDLGIVRNEPSVASNEALVHNTMSRPDDSSLEGHYLLEDPEKLDLDLDSSPDLGIVRNEPSVASNEALVHNTMSRPDDSSLEGHYLLEDPVVFSDAADIGDLRAGQEVQRVLEPSTSTSTSTDCAVACTNGRPIINVSGWEFSSLIHSCVSSPSDCPYNLPINCWDTSRVTDMYGAFMESRSSPGSFNEPLNCWDVSSVTDMNNMFQYLVKFNQPIGDWDVSKVEDMSGMFSHAASFNQPIGDWDVSKVSHMNKMFEKTYDFNQPIGGWDISSVTNIFKMFYYAVSFNQPIGDWDVSRLSSIFGMFDNASNFNQPIGDWDLSSMEYLSVVFHKASSFNQPLDKWDVSNVKGMWNLFDGASSFNQPIGDWDVSKLGSMRSMFDGATSFNQPLDKWDVSSVGNMMYMFRDATSFNQCLSTWASKTPTDVYTEDMLKESGCPQQSDPDPSVGPWCQTETESCSVDLGPCTNKGTFRFKRETYTCTDLENFSSKMRNKACNKRPAKKACPGVCNVRCVCEDKKFFRIKPNSDNDFRGKFRCKNVNKDQQPSCDTKVKKGKLVKEVCPKQCGFCL